MAFSKKVREFHREKNEIWWKEHKHESMGDAGYIEYQPQLHGLFYGVHNNFLSKIFLNNRPLSAACNSCEIISVYNALFSLEGKAPEGDLDFPGLIQCFEKKGIFFRGYFGTKAWALTKFFKKRGYQVNTLWFKKITPERLDELSSEGTFLFMAMNNRHNIWDMIHTMSITREGDKFMVHNDYEGNRKYDRLSSAVFEYNDRESWTFYFLQVKKGEQ